MQSAPKQIIPNFTQVRGVAADIQGTTDRSGGPHVRLSAEKKRRSVRKAKAVAAGVPAGLASVLALG